MGDLLFVIWFEYKNKLFQKPDKVNYHIKEWNDKNHINIAHDIKEKYNV